MRIEAAITAAKDRAKVPDTCYDHSLSFYQLTVSFKITERPKPPTIVKKEHP